MFQRGVHGLTRYRANAVIYIIIIIIINATHHVTTSHDHMTHHLRSIHSFNLSHSL